MYPNIASVWVGEYSSWNNVKILIRFEEIYVIDYLTIHDKNHMVKTTLC